MGSVSARVKVRIGGHDPVRSRVYSPERRLWQAVLIQACKDLGGIPDRDRGAGSHAASIRSARDWFRTAACREICELAGVDYRLVRRLFDSGELERRVLDGDFQKGMYLTSMT